MSFRFHPTLASIQSPQNQVISNATTRCSGRLRKYHIFQLLLSVKLKSPQKKNSPRTKPPETGRFLHMNRLLPLALIVVLLIAFRIVGSMYPETIPNFQPLAALFFCGVFIAKGWRSWAIPLAAWLVTYPAPALISGNTEWMGAPTLIGTALGFAATYFIGKSLMKRGLGTLLLGSIAAALAFHAITNGIAWAMSPMYPKNLTGIVQSLWTGPAASPIPSWVFLRNMAAANVLFTGIFLSARFAVPTLATTTQPQHAR